MSSHQPVYYSSLVKDTEIFNSIRKEFDPLEVYKVENVKVIVLDRVFLGSYISKITVVKETLRSRKTVFTKRVYTVILRGDLKRPTYRSHNKTRERRLFQYDL